VQAVSAVSNLRPWTTGIVAFTSAEEIQSMEALVSISNSTLGST
jgi:hypothetical protein